MGLLELAGRELIRKGSEQFLKKTQTGKKIVESLTKKPQTPQGEGLSFGGVTSSISPQAQRAITENDKVRADITAIEGFVGKSNKEIIKAVTDYSNPDIDIEDFFKNSSEFMNMGFDSKRSGEFRDAVVKSTRGDADANKLIAAKVSTKAFEDFKFYRKKVDEAKSINAGKKEGQIEGFVSGQGANVPFVGDKVTELFSKGFGQLGRIGESTERFPSFRETEQAKNELEMEGKYDKANAGRVAGMLQVGFTGYGVAGKLVDKGLLASKVPGFIKPIQETLRQSYVNNPTLFNLVSNSAQEAIEYGVRKGIGDEDYSVKDFALGLGLGAIASKFSKGMDSVFDGVTQKDLKNIDSRLASAKKFNPDITDKELIDGIADVKLGNGMTLGELKDNFIKGNSGKISEALETNHDAVSNFFRSAGVNITTGASKRVNDVINTINTKIKSGGDVVGDVFTSAGKGDLGQMKSEIIAEVSALGKASTQDVDAIIKKISDAHGLPVKYSKEIDMFDEAEDLLIKGWDISDLANPHSYQNFRKTFADENVYDDTKLIKLDEQIFIDTNRKGRGIKEEANRLNSVLEATAKRDNELKELGFNNMNDFLKSRYKISDTQVKSIIKEARSVGTKGRYTKQEVSDAIMKIRDESIAAEEKVNSLFRKLEGMKSAGGDTDKVLLMTQLNKNLEMVGEGSYAGVLDQFVKDTSLLIKDGKTWMSIKEEKAAKLANDSSIIASEAANTKNGKFEYSILDDKTQSIGKTKKALTYVKKAWKNITMRDSVGNYFDSYSRVFDRMLGENSYAKKILHGDIFNAEGLFRADKRSLVVGVDSALRKSGLHPDNKQQLLEFSIAMHGRSGIGDRVYKANNIFIEESSGKLLYRKKGEIVDSTGFRKLTEKDVTDITKKYTGDAKMQPAFQYLDNTFMDSATRLNTMISRATGKIIPPEQKYFPLNYFDVMNKDLGDDSADTLSQMFTKHIDQGFLNSKKKAPPGDFSIDLDINNTINKFADRQLYFIHMKDSIMNAKRVVTGANRLADTDDFIMKEGGDIEFKDIDMDMEDTSKSILAPGAMTYFKGFIEDVSSHGMVGRTNKTSLARFYSKASTFLSLAANVFVVAAQPLSKLDTLLNTSPKAFSKSLVMGLNDVLRSGPDVDSIKLSGVLQTRMTEGKLGFEGAGIFKNSDLKDFGHSNWKDAPIEYFNNYFMRLVKRVDGEVSNSIWQGYFMDYVQKNHTEVKGWKVGTLANQMSKEDLNVAVRYADDNMIKVVGGSDMTTQGSRAAAKWGDMYSIGTAVQKTFINRFMFLNDVLEKRGYKALPQLALVTALYEWGEYEREYAKQLLLQYTGSKKKEEGVDVNIFGVNIGGKGTHIGNLVANNPSLAWDTTTIDLIKAKYPSLKEDEIGGILGAKLFLNAIKHTVVNPTNTYDMLSQPTKIGGKIYNNIVKDEYPVQSRFYIEIAEDTAKWLLPGHTDEFVNSLHELFLDEPVWKTKEDNYQLGKALSGNKELAEDVESKTFEEQSAFANQKRGEYETNKAIQGENAKENGAKENARQLIYKKYGYNPTKSEVAAFAKENMNLLKEGGISDTKALQSFYKTLGPAELNKNRVSEYQHLYGKTAEFILENDLKKFVDNKDMTGLKARVNELKDAGVIMSPTFNENLVKVMKKKGYVK